MHFVSHRISIRTIRYIVLMITDIVITKQKQKQNKKEGEKIKSKREKFKNFNSIVSPSYFEQKVLVFVRNRYAV